MKFVGITLTCCSIWRVEDSKVGLSVLWQFRKEIVRFNDTAILEQGVMIRDGQHCTGLISMEEYQRLKCRGRRVFAAGELPEEVIEAVARSKMDPRYRHLDDLVKD